VSNSRQTQIADRNPARRNPYGVLQRQPFAWALVLQMRNRLRGQWLRLILSCALALLVLAVGTRLATKSGLSRTALQFLDAHGSWILLLALLHAAFVVSERRRTLISQLQSSWLAPTPRANQVFTVTLIAGVFATLVFQVFAVVLVIALLGFADFALAAGTLTDITGGAAIGAVLGWWFGSRKARERAPGSRYVPRVFGSRASSAVSLRALSRWPVTQTLAAADPDSLRWPMMAAMLSVTAGSSMATGLGVVAFWMVVLYVFILCRSTLRAAESSAQWLRSTPMSYTVFARTLGLRSLIHQCAGAALVAGYLALDGTPFFAALLAVSPWVAFIIVAYSTAIAHAYRARSGTRWSIAIAACVIAGGESLQRGCSIPLSVVVAAWHWRQGAKA
jgi:hypothetical protein